MTRTAPANTDAIGRGTKRSWAEWLDFLGRIGAEELSHKEIARRVVETGDASGWWAQSITVAYEQHIGRRAPGQDNAGRFQVSVTKTLAGSMDAALERFSALMAGRNELDGVAIARAPDTSSTEKWRYWRCGLADGSRVGVTIHQKAPDKAGLGVGHEGLASDAEVARWRGFWKGLLAGL